MELVAAFWAVLGFALCLLSADASQLLAAALRRAVGQSPAAAARKVERLLQQSLKSPQPPDSAGGSHASTPLVVAVCNPLERSSLRRLLGCSHTRSADGGQEGGVEAEPSGSKRFGEVLKDWWQPQWRGLLSSAGIGLDLLQEHALLLTLELPTAGGLSVLHALSGSTPTKNKVETNTRTSAKIQQAQALGKVSGDVLPEGVVKPDTDKTKKVRTHSVHGVPNATEAAVIAAIAVPLVEAADVLLVPLLYPGAISAPLLPVYPPGKQCGELLCVGSAKVASEGGSLEPGSGTAGSSNSGGTHETRLQPPPVATATGGCCRLPEGVVQLLRAMKQLVHTQTAQKAAENTEVHRYTHSHDRKKQHILQVPRPRRRLPHLVLLLGEPVSPAMQTEIRDEVARHVGSAEAQVSILVVQQPDAPRRIRDKLGRLIQETHRTTQAGAHFADSLGAFLSGASALGSPSSVEFPSRVLACSVCVTAARRALVAARERISGLQNVPGRRSHAFGGAAHAVISEALLSYDSHTRKYQVMIRTDPNCARALCCVQLSSERKVLREELQHSLARELRSLYVQKALQIESDARAELRPALVAALQKDARLFGAVAHDILKTALTTVNRQLLGLLGPAGTGITGPLNGRASHIPMAPADALIHRGTSEILGTSAKTARDAWLCHSFSTSLLELHLLLVQKITRSFLLLASELSRSPLAALLRQQHNRPWLGLSIRPSLSVATLLRMRGEGNLQGYSRYNAGAVNFLFGFTNDGEGLERGQQAAIRLQPKLHLDVELD